MSRAFYTPPINVSVYNAEQAVQESYKHDTTYSRTATPSLAINNQDVVKLTQTEIKEIRNRLVELPAELLKIIETFIQDLKQPKYSQPLTTNQLSSVFQSFYIRFDKSAFHYLSNITNNNNSTNTINFLPSRESLSTGLGGIFAFNRSRSSSINSSNNNTNNNNNNIRTRNRRSSSLFSNASNTSNNLPLLSQEEIAKQLKNNAINSVKINRFMELCEETIFTILANVGTAVSNDIATEPILVKKFDITTLFKNTVEFTEFAKLLDEKIHCLNEVSQDASTNLSLIEFLDIPRDICLTHVDSLNELTNLFDNLNNGTTISPYGKINILIQIHEVLQKWNAHSNDEFLPMLIYYIIKIKPNNLFLNINFIKLFRYKKKLIENELFVLTNFEAALVFIESLTISDLPEQLREQHFATDNEKLFICKITDMIEVPIITNNKDIQMIESINYNSNTNHLTNHDVENFNNTANSYDGIRSVFDSSIKTIFTKIKSTSVSNQNSDSEIVKEEDNLVRSGSHSSINFDKTLTTMPSNENIPIPSNENRNRNHDDTIPEQWKKYKHKQFDELKINELREIFDIYQKMLD